MFDLIYSATLGIVRSIPAGWDRQLQPPTSFHLRAIDPSTGATHQMWSTPSASKLVLPLGIKAALDRPCFAVVSATLVWEMTCVSVEVDSNRWNCT